MEGLAHNSSGRRGTRYLSGPTSSRSYILRQPVPAPFCAPLSAPLPPYSVVVSGVTILARPVWPPSVGWPPLRPVVFGGCAEAEVYGIPSILLRCECTFQWCFAQDPVLVFPASACAPSLTSFFVVADDRGCRRAFRRRNPSRSTS